MKRWFYKIISLVCVLPILLTSTVAFASGSEFASVESANSEDVLALAKSPEPVSELYFTKSITSTNSEGLIKQEDIVNTKIVKSSKSLWYNDGDLAYNVITTYDNHGAVKHYRDKVEVYLYQNGQGKSSSYIMINGERKPISGTIDKVISSYPRPFVVLWKYTIEKKDIDPNEPFTIFTIGTIETTNPGQSTPYTRHEANLHIYWAD